MALLFFTVLAVTTALLWRRVSALRDRVAMLERTPSTSPWAPPAELPALVQRPPTRLVAPPPPPHPAPVPEPVAVQPAPEPQERPDPPVSSERAFSFEDIFGRKLPIWTGGVTLAVCGLLLVKYSIDSGLFSPAVRVIAGLLFGAGLIAGAEAALRGHLQVRDPRIRQALAGAGIATLYADVLVAGDLYHLIGGGAAFAGLALVTLLAAFLSLRTGAPSAVLGLVGGLAAPALVEAGAPDVPLLATYLALAVGGLATLGRAQRWMWLGVAALIGGFGWGWR